MVSSAEKKLFAINVYIFFFKRCVCLLLRKGAGSSLTIVCLADSLENHRLLFSNFCKLLRKSSKSLDSTCGPIGTSYNYPLRITFLPKKKSNLNVKIIKKIIYRRRTFNKASLFLIKIGLHFTCYASNGVFSTNQMQHRNEPNN